MPSLVGFRPTGKLHIGHYFSVVKPALEYDAAILCADLHAPGKDTAKIAKENTNQLILRFGIKKSAIMLQSTCLDEKLYFGLMAIAPVGALSRMTQYKCSPDRKRTAHLFTYPVLMTHDVACWGKVYVGQDQKQHMELAKQIINRYNRVYDGQLTVPEVTYTDINVRDLRDPTSKMSKSNPKGCLFLDDTPEQVKAKVKAAVTTPEGRAALETLYKKLGGVLPPDCDNENLKILLTSTLMQTVYGGTNTAK